MLKYDEFLVHKLSFLLLLELAAENINFRDFQTKIMNNSQNSS